MEISFGSVSARGRVENEGSGDWTVTSGEVGRYRIEISGGRETPPVVLATGSITRTALAEDNAFSVEVESPTSFVVFSRDVAGWHENELQNAGFSFVALWP